MNRCQRCLGSLLLVMARAFFLRVFLFRTCVQPDGGRHAHYKHHQNDRPMALRHQQQCHHQQYSGDCQQGGDLGIEPREEGLLHPVDPSILFLLLFFPPLLLGDSLGHEIGIFQAAEYFSCHLLRSRLINHVLVLEVSLHLQQRGVLGVQSKALFQSVFAPVEVIQRQTGLGQSVQALHVLRPNLQGSLRGGLGRYRVAQLQVCGCEVRAAIGHNVQGHGTHTLSVPLLDVFGRLHAGIGEELDAGGVAAERFVVLLALVVVVAVGLPPCDLLDEIVPGRLRGSGDAQKLHQGHPQPHIGVRRDGLLARSGSAQASGTPSHVGSAKQLCLLSLLHVPQAKLEHRNSLPLSDAVPHFRPAHQQLALSGLL
mmetsp:Transcript_96904/g.273470  ORF Transcript_96904/g.273470 Transcript_96904/m.273470 type:complete len:369 (+) Transcript_96904:44-1150(+)